jgi:hypothetical protein
MSDRDRTSLFSANKTTILGIILVLALFAPAGIQWTRTGFQMFSMAWTISNVYPLDRWFFEFVTAMGDFSFYIFVAFLRCLFAYQVKRYYEYRARLGVTLFFGWVIECILPLYAIISVVSGILFGYNIWALPLPTPLMVVVAWFLIKKNPRGEDKGSWTEKEPART